MGILGQWVAERLSDEDLPRRVREMLLGADDVRDFEVKVIDHARQMIEAGAVGPLDDVILLAGPIEFDVAADMIVDDELSLARHLEPHDSLSPFALEPHCVGGGLGHPAATVEK